jgi:hypothetical protein
METLTLESLAARDAELAAMEKEIIAERADIAAARRLLLKQKPTVSEAIVGAVVGVRDVVTAMNAGRIAEQRALDLEKEARSNGLRPLRHGKPTTAMQIMEVLRNSPDREWLTANEIQDRIADKTGITISMSTLSPTLSDLKSKGHILREGFKVALKSRVEEFV